MNRSNPPLVALLLASAVACCGSPGGTIENPGSAQAGQPAPAGADPGIPPGGATSIEGLFVGLTIGINTGDADAITVLLPPPELFKDVIMCPQGSALADIAAKAVVQIQALMTLVKGKGIGIEFDELQVLEDRTKQFAPGDAITDECTAGMDMTMSVVSFRMFVTKDGQLMNDDRDSFIVLRIGGETGPWYLIGPD